MLSAVSEDHVTPSACTADTSKQWKHALLPCTGHSTGIRPLAATLPVNSLRELTSENRKYFAARLVNFDQSQELILPRENHALETYSKKSK